jgi:hypothetical protein
MYEVEIVPLESVFAHFIDSDESFDDYQPLHSSPYLYRFRRTGGRVSASAGVMPNRSRRDRIVPSGMPLLSDH